MNIYKVILESKKSKDFTFTIFLGGDCYEDVLLKYYDNYYKKGYKMREITEKYKEIIKELHNYYYEIYSIGTSINNKGREELFVFPFARFVDEEGIVYFIENYYSKKIEKIFDIVEVKLHKDKVGILSFSIYEGKNYLLNSMILPKLKNKDEEGIKEEVYNKILQDLRALNDMHLINLFYLYKYNVPPFLKKELNERIEYIQEIYKEYYSILEFVNDRVPIKREKDIVKYIIENNIDYTWFLSFGDKEKRKIEQKKEYTKILIKLLFK